MLSIFIKYGKPLEDDEKVLFRNKLIEVFEELTNEECQEARRQKAYGEMADLQVKEIIRTMRTCTSTRGEQNTTQSYNEGVSRSMMKSKSRPSSSSDRFKSSEKTSFSSSINHMETQNLDTLTT